jgi:thiol-disulfide isomerase/thioredoxin
MINKLTKLKRLMLITVILLSSAVCINAQGIQFNTGNWNSILQKAKAQNKLIFMDVYTSWCGPCKKMASQTFTQKEVGDFYNTNFICYKIDAEKGEGIAIAKKYEVTAYPNCLYITGNGELAYRFVGAKDVKEVLAEGNKALKYVQIMPKMKEMKAQYKAGKRDKAFLKEYVDLLISSGEKPEMALTEYLNMLPDDELYTKENMAKFKELSVYNKNFFNRLSAHYKSLPDSSRSKMERPIMIAISGCLTPIIDGKKENTDIFEHLMSIKESMHVKSGIVSVLFGGGVAYMPTDEMRISFYQTANPNKFKELFKEFIQKNINMPRADSLHTAALGYRKYNFHKLDSLKAVNDTTGIKETIKTWKLTNAIMNLTYDSEMSFIVGTAIEYWKQSDKSADIRKKCEDCALYAFKIYDRPSIAQKCAELLTSLNEKDKAKQVLEEAIKWGKADVLGSISKEDLEKTEAQLQKLNK